jgi:hypothetical protein
MENKIRQDGTVSVDVLSKNGTPFKDIREFVRRTYWYNFDMLYNMLLTVGI